MLDKKLILINDVSVLFDILDLNLFDAYFQLGHKLVITPQIIAEIKDEIQKLKINQYIQEDKISIDNFGPFEAINQLFDKYSGLSFADCSVMESAIRNKGFIISSDMALRKNSQLENIEVKGLLWLIEELSICKIITEEFAIKKLIQYTEINIRAPIKDILMLLKKLQHQ